MIKAFAKVEDRPTPPEVYGPRIYLCASVAAAAAIMIGYDSAFIGTSISLASFRSELGIAVGQIATVDFAAISANIVSTYQAGAFFGSVLGYPLGNFAGRKWGLLVAGLIFEIGAGIMCATGASTGLWPLYLGRALAGLGIGMASNLAPLYISEVSPPAIRGRLVGMYEIGWQIGGIVGFFINYGMVQTIPSSHKQWIIPFWVQLIPGGLFAIGVPLFIRESPRWLAVRGKREQAVINLSFLRNLDASHPFLLSEMADIDASVITDRQLVGTSFFGPFRVILQNGRYARRLLITTSLFLFQNGTGINAINYYSPTVFASLGITGTNTSLLTTGIFGVIKTLGALLWAFFIIDQFGRRGIMLVGSVGGAFAMYFIGGYISIAQPAANPTTDLPSGGRAAIAFFYIWTIFYAISWNGTPWVVNSEVFPAGSVRQVCQMSAASSNWLWNFVISRATPTMFLKMGKRGGGEFVYVFFASMMVLSIFYLIFLLPETKHIPLESMDRLWATRPVWGANTKVMAELQREHATSSSKNSLDHNSLRDDEYSSEK